MNCAVAAIHTVLVATGLLLIAIGTKSLSPGSAPILWASVVVVGAVLGYLVMYIQVTFRRRGHLYINIQVTLRRQKRSIYVHPCYIASVLGRPGGSHMMLHGRMHVHACLPHWQEQRERDAAQLASW